MKKIIPSLLMIGILMTARANAHPEDGCSIVLKNGVFDSNTSLTHASTLDILNEAYCRDSSSEATGLLPNGTKLGFESNSEMCKQIQSSSYSTSTAINVSKQANSNILKAWSECKSHKKIGFHQKIITPHKNRVIYRVSYSRGGFQNVEYPVVRRFTIDENLTCEPHDITPDAVIDENGFEVVCARANPCEPTSLRLITKNTRPPGDIYSGEIPPFERWNAKSLVLSENEPLDASVKNLPYVKTKCEFTCIRDREPRTDCLGAKPVQVDEKIQWGDWVNRGCRSDGHGWHTEIGTCNTPGVEGGVGFKPCRSVNVTYYEKEPSC